MKLLLVFLNNEFRTFVPPNLSALEAYIKKAGHETRVFDTSFFPDVINVGNIERNIEAGTYKGVDYFSSGVARKTNDSLDEFLKVVSEYEPDLIGFSLYGYTAHIAEKLSAGAKARFPQIPIIYGGIEVTLHAKEYVQKEYVDIACVGEGEAALLELCDRIEKGLDDFTGIPNLWTKDPVTGTPIGEKFGDFIDLDDLGEPDWTSFEPYHQLSPLNGKLYRMAIVEFSRGCPYSCTYCESSTLKFMHAKEGIKKYVRHKSPQKFVQECKTLVDKYDIEMFYFCDGTFLVMSNDVLEELATLWRSQVNKPFFCLTTAPSVTDRRTELLKEMGCVQVNMGVEAGDEQYRKDVLGRPRMTNETIINAFQTMRRVGITTSSYNMIGMPWQERDDVFQTIELNRLCEPDYVNVSIFIPFEGTMLLDRLRKEGHVGTDLILGDESRATVKVPSSLSLEEVERIHKVFTLYCKVPSAELATVKKYESDPLRYRREIENMQDKYLAFSSPLPAALQRSQTHSRTTASV